MNYNERDIEHPGIVNFVKSHPVKSLLDVGCAYSYFTYADELRPLVEVYEGIDILQDSKTAQILDKYHIGNILSHKGEYDLVACISTIEHAGLSSYKIKDHQLEQRKVYKKIFELAKKYIYITFPFGQPAVHPGEFANIDKDQIKYFRSLGGKVKTTFYFSEYPQRQIPFTEISEQDAEQVEYLQERGTRCACLMEVIK